MFIRMAATLRRHGAPILLGAMISASLLAVGSPGAGLAAAHAGEDHDSPSASGDAVGRPALDNPAPRVRLYQAVGDKIYNRNTSFNRALDDSTWGQGYHERYGWSAGSNPNEEDGGTGSNGFDLGILNMGNGLAAYNFLQAAKVPLPDEKDLSGSVIRAVSGREASTGGGHGHQGHEHDGDAHGVHEDVSALSADRSRCVDVTSTGTIVSVSCAGDE